MSTRARIGLLQSDGLVCSIYTHYDGYPSHHGPILLDHYNTVERVQALLALGALSALNANLGEKVDFNKPAKDQCISYSRDLNEVEAESYTAPLGGFFQACDGCDYIYLARVNQGELEWIAAPYKTRDPIRQSALFRPLAEVVSEEVE